MLVFSLREGPLSDIKLSSEACHPEKSGYILGALSLHRECAKNNNLPQIVQLDSNGYLLMLVEMPCISVYPILPVHLG